MKSLRNLAAAILLAVAAGCVTASKESAEGSGPGATCEVCRHNNDLACVNIHVTETTPRFEYQGSTYCFCSEDCKVSFAKNPSKYARK